MPQQVLLNRVNVFIADILTVRKSTLEESHEQTVSFDVEHTDLTDEQMQLLLTFLHQHRSVFVTNLQELGQANTQPQCIETDDAFPIRFYRQSPHTATEMNRQLQDLNFNVDIIEESDYM